MTIPSNGITPEVIRGVMHPYRLSPDLLAATIAALPAPPPDTTTAWRQARLASQLQEIAALKPADAAQAHIAAQLLTTRVLADTFIARAQAPNLEINQMCRLGRTGAELFRSAAGLDRTLARHQQKPTPFFGTVISRTRSTSQPSKPSGPAEPRPPPHRTPRPPPAQPPKPPPRHRPPHQPRWTRHPTRSRHPSSSRCSPTSRPIR
jgi:hypothetical protein